MGKKHFVVIVCKLFSTEEILKRHIKDCFKINGKQSILMPKKGEYGQFKNYERKTKSRFIIGSFIKMVLKKEHVDSLIEEKRKKHYVLFKDFNTFMYNHTLHHGKKTFCRYCLQAF